MKKLAVLIMFALAAGFAAGRAAAQTPEAVILELSGTVELKESGAGGWVAAKQGDRVAKDTLVSTGFKSAAILSVGSSTITVRPLTIMSLTEIVSRNETETVNVNLSTGRIRAEVNPPSGNKASFTVQTPMAVASVRGTKFGMNTAKLIVEEGSVLYMPANKTVNRPVIVNAGRESWIDGRTGRAVHPSSAQEETRRLPVMPGPSLQQAGGARVTPPSADEDKDGSFTVEPVF
jgi:hypothetical protein